MQINDLIKINDVLSKTQLTSNDLLEIVNNKNFSIYWNIPEDLSITFTTSQSIIASFLMEKWNITGKLSAYHFQSKISYPYSFNDPTINKPRQSGLGNHHIAINLSQDSNLNIFVEITNNTCKLQDSFFYTYIHNQLAGTFHPENIHRIIQPYSKAPKIFYFEYLNKKNTVVSIDVNTSLLQNIPAIFIYDEIEWNENTVFKIFNQKTINYPIFKNAYFMDSSSNNLMDVYKLNESNMVEKALNTAEQRFFIVNNKNNSLIPNYTKTEGVKVQFFDLYLKKTDIEAYLPPIPAPIKNNLHTFVNSEITAFMEVNTSFIEYILQNVQDAYFMSGRFKYEVRKR